MRLKYMGIVGAEKAKFSPQAEIMARCLIRNILAGPVILVSGGCHLGGVDIWAEEEFKATEDLRPPGLEAKIYRPKYLGWPAYKERNLLIAQKADFVNVIVVNEYPDGYVGQKFPACYHCLKTDHIKSGACWTAKKAVELGKTAFWYVIGQDGKLVNGWERKPK